MSVVYRKIARYKCLLLDDYCIASPRPNCRNGCVVYKTWKGSPGKIKAKDYAHQKTVDDFPPASSEPVIERGPTNDAVLEN